MKELVKKSLRLTTDHFDDEVENLIESALLDLNITGVVTGEGDNDALIQRAVITYAKAHFGYDNPESDRFNDSYIMLKHHLSLSGDYRET